MARRGDNIHKRKDGRWEGRYKDGFRTDGSVKYSSAYAYSYFECKKKLADAQVSQSKTVSTTHPEILFSELLVRWLFANQICLKGATSAKYSNIIESHIIPGLGNEKPAVFFYLRVSRCFAPCGDFQAEVGKTHAEEHSSEIRAVSGGNETGGKIGRFSAFRWVENQAAGYKFVKRKMKYFFLSPCIKIQTPRCQSRVKQACFARP